MTTQFRSRIKTAFEFPESAAATGGCCLPDGTKLSGSTITLSECSRQNGYFQQGDPDLLVCPDRGLTGCCCACSYIREQDGNFDVFLDPNNTSNYYGQPPIGTDINEKGIKDNVTQCECNRREGKWFYGKCNEIGNLESLCGNYQNTPPNDVRFPAACCHGNSFENDLTCTNVCTAKECSDLASTDYPYTNYFGEESGGNGALCAGSGSVGDIGTVDCSIDAITSQRLPSSRTDTNQNLTQTEAFFRARTRQIPCLELTTVDNQLKHTCSMKTPVECNAANGFEYSTTNNKVPVCSDAVSYPPVRGSGSYRVFPPTTVESNMPNIGDAFQGGVFAGIFEPGVSSVVRRRNTELVTEIARKEGNGTNKRKWGLIFSYRPYGNEKEESVFNKVKYQMNDRSNPILQTPTSFYDGFYNTHGDGKDYLGYPSTLFEEIRSLVFSGFNDWYVPSIDELSFIYKNQSNLLCEFIQECVYENYYSNIEYRLQYVNMMSSTLWSENDKLGKDSTNGQGQIVRRRGYVYVQNMVDSNLKDTGGLIYKEDRRKTLMVPLVRRVYIE